MLETRTSRTTVNPAGNVKDVALSRRAALLLGLSSLGVVLLVLYLSYFPFYLLFTPDIQAAGATGATAVSLPPESEYVLQPEYLLGRYIVPLLGSMAVAGVNLLWVLRTRGWDR